MNERIKLLAEQSGMTQYVAAENKYLEKFAELIVKECLDVLNPVGDLTSMREEYGRCLAMNIIKKHFGVEE